MRRALTLAVILCAAALLARPAQAQLGQLGGFTGGGHTQPINKDQPVTFTADQVTYDRDNGIVTATGNVEAWQNDHILRADKITFDRNTNVAAATGHVVLLEPDGQVLFSDYAELTQGMKDGVLRGMRAILAQNGKLAANGARRTGGEINELSRVVYSTCNVCAKDPSKPPLWQLRAYSGVQDLQNKRIEFYDATMEFAGYPVGYLPYFNTADPSVKRATGLLIPSVGQSSALGQFIAIPYYIVLDDSSDVTVTPLITTKSGPDLDVDYRRRFNDGELKANGSVGEVNGSLQGSIYSTGRFTWDDTFRYGFDLDRASSVDYIRNFQLGRFFGGVSDVLTSDAYVEGFGQGAYTKLDTRFYQGLTTSIVDSKLPVVLPRFEYSYFGTVDPLGGRLSVDTTDFNVLRTVGTNTRRAALTLNYERPFSGPLGDQWKAQIHIDSAAYDATSIDNQPTFGTVSHDQVERAQPQVALDGRWPFLRDSGDWGSQIIEPMAEVVVSPVVGDSQYRRIPNEDSLDLEFTDANLFGFNRFPGIDRLEGGTRANVALHAEWLLNGTTLDGKFGQSFRTNRDLSMPYGSGLSGIVSDYVGHVTFAPAPWFDVTYRTRLDHNDFKTRLADAVVTAGVPTFSVNGGYLYSTFNPYALYDTNPQTPPASYFIPRNEVTAGFTTRYSNYRLSAYARRDLQTSKMVGVGAEAAYEDECFIFDAKFYKRYTSIDNDNGATAVLFTLTFKTVGQFGFHAF
jgi:LPS-assembly protein